jgi:uncharacterized protein
MKRDIAPDVLRGFALLGILVVNIQFMGLNSDQGARGEWTQGFANGSATFLIAALFAGKFYLLFSFLFGYSSNYVIGNDRSNRARWIKRCFVLIAFGALHFTFLWHGDIIFVYGLFGLFLTFFFFRADRTLKIWSRVVFSISTFLILIIGSLALIAEYFLEEDLGLSTVSSLDEILQNGTFLDSIPARLSRGESVITAEATASSRNLLEAIQERKIDDSILNKMAKSGGAQINVFDDSNIIKAIEKYKNIS